MAKKEDNAAPDARQKNIRAKLVHKPDSWYLFRKYVNAADPTWFVRNRILVKHWAIGGTPLTKFPMPRGRGLRAWYGVTLPIRAGYTYGKMIKSLELVRDGCTKIVGCFLNTRDFRESGGKIEAHCEEAEEIAARAGRDSFKLPPFWLEVAECCEGRRETCPSQFTDDVLASDLHLMSRHIEPVADALIQIFKGENEAETPDGEDMSFVNFMHGIGALAADAWGELCGDTDGKAVGTVPLANAIGEQIEDPCNLASEI